MSRDYGRVYTSFWNSADVRCLSDNGRLMALFLLTNPHSNIIGAYLLPDAYLMDGLQWEAARVRTTVSELWAQGFAKRFRDGRHVVICRYLEWNPIENRNVGMAAVKQAEQLDRFDPAFECVLTGLALYKRHFAAEWESVVERLSKPTLNGLITLPEGLYEQVRTPEPEKELEPEPEKEGERACARSASEDGVVSPPVLAIVPPSPADVVPPPPAEVRQVIERIPGNVIESTAEIPSFLLRDPLEQFMRAGPWHSAIRSDVQKLLEERADVPLPDELVASAKRYFADWAKKNTQRAKDKPAFAVSAATFIRKAMWNDYPPPPKIGTSTDLRYTWGAHPAGVAIRTELGDGEFGQWFAPCVLKMVDSVPILKAPTRLIRDWLATKHMDRLERAFGSQVILSLEEEEVAA